METDTNSPISMPVGPETLGRIMNVVGEPVDERGDIKTSKTYPIHRPAPKFVLAAPVTNYFLGLGVDSRTPFLCF